MSSMYITEYTGVAQRQGSAVAIPLEPAVAVQKISFTGTPGTSVAFNAATKFVRVHVDGIASLLFSIAGTAAAVTDPRYPADASMLFAVTPNTGLKVSAITNT